MPDHDLQLGEIVDHRGVLYEVFSLFMCTDGPFMARLRKLETLEIMPWIVLTGGRGYTRQKQSIELLGDEFTRC